jgi:hypothetical protein
MRYFLFLLLMIPMISVADVRPFSFYQTAQDVLQTTFRQLEEVGVIRLDPYHPSLPYPQVSAVEALYQPRTQIVAYFDHETVLGGMNYVFKAWNGGNRHRISYNEEDINFVTPYLGTVAHANRFKTTAGWQYDFYCRSRHVSKPEWDRCIQNLFIDVITRQLAR